MIRIRRDQEITLKVSLQEAPQSLQKQGNFSTGRNRKCHSGNQKSIVAGRLFQKHLMFLRLSAHETYFRSIQRWFWLYQAFQHAKSGKCNSTNSVCASLLPSLAKQVPNCAGNMIWEHNACKGYVTITLCMHLVLVILDYSRKYLYPIMVGINILLPSPLSLTMKIPKCNLKMLYHPLPSELHLLITAPSLSEFPLF